MFSANHIRVLIIPYFSVLFKKSADSIFSLVADVENFTCAGLGTVAHTSSEKYVKIPYM